MTAFNLAIALMVTAGVVGAYGLYLHYHHPGAPSEPEDATERLKREWTARCADEEQRLQQQAFRGRKGGE